MPSYVTPKKNTEYIFYISLVSQADTKLLQVNPTLAPGDVKVSTDGGAEGNITTLPVVTPAGSKRVKVTLSAAEMNGDNIQVTFSDAAGAEWADLTVNTPTTVTQIDDSALASVCTEGRLSELDAGNLPADIKRVLGLTGENIVWDDTTYVDGKMTAATGYQYSSKANAVTHNKSTGLIGKWTYDATITSDNTTLMRRVKES